MFVVAQAFQPAGSGDFPVARSDSRLESPPNPQPGKAALQRRESDSGAGKSQGLQSSQPISIRCAVAKGKLKIAIGPWRASGHWWEPGAWHREEWDVQMQDGSVYRLNRDRDEWKVEGLLD